MEGMEAVAHNPPALKQQRDRAQKLGFSLIEAAIVLAVVGLVVAGIWVAAAEMYENYKVNKTVEGIFTIEKNAQQLISISNAIVIGNAVNITPTLLASGAYPKDWNTGRYPNEAEHPFGGSSHIRQYTSSPQRFDFYLYTLPKSACTKIVNKISLLAASELTQINVNGVTTYPSNMPISLDNSRQMCSQNIQTLNLTFIFTRIN